MHNRLLDLAEEGKAYLSVIYNVGLVAFLAATLGLLMNKISDLISHEQHTVDKTDDPDKADPQQ